MLQAQTCLVCLFFPDIRCLFIALCVISTLVFYPMLLGNVWSFVWGEYLGQNGGWLNENKKGVRPCGIPSYNTGNYVNQPVLKELWVFTLFGSPMNVHYVCVLLLQCQFHFYLFIVPFVHVAYK